MEVLADTSVKSVGKSRMFDSAYLSADANYEKWLYPGTPLAVHSTTAKYVPYSAAASYGTGSDTPVVVTTEPYDMTYGACAVTGIWSGKLIQDNCQLFGGALGTIPAAVKSALTNIEWV